MDVNGVESVQLLVRGGADLITIDDLTGTNVTNVNVELGVADGAVDRVIVNGTTGDDNISVVGGASAVMVGGLAATVAVTNPEAANDRLDVNTLTGNNIISVSQAAHTLVHLFVDGSEILFS